MKYYYWRTRIIWRDTLNHREDHDNFMASPRNKVDIMNYQFKMWRRYKKQYDNNYWDKLLELTESLEIDVLAIFNVFQNNGDDPHYPGLHVIIPMTKEEETLFLLGLDHPIEGFKHHKMNPLTALEQKFVFKV